MNVRISCPFVIKNSGSANSPGFFGDNTVELAPFKQEGLLGLGGTNIEVSLLSHRRYLLEVVSDCLPDESGQIDYLKKVAEYLSFLLNRDESNPHFGNSFVSLDWYEFASIPSPEAGDHINDQVQVNSGIRLEAKFRVATMREVAFSDRHDKDRRHHDVLRFYFGGLSAEDKKSKYFHWFLVLECLEHSPGYKQRFSRKLFDSEEEQRLRKIAGELNDDSKKSAILGLLARTKYSRSRKLFEFVRAVGVDTISFCGDTVKVDEGMIKKIIGERNRIFHSGADFPEAVLWFSLFPLATTVVERIMGDPGWLGD